MNWSRMIGKHTAIDIRLDLYHWTFVGLGLWFHLSRPSSDHKGAYLSITLLWADMSIEIYDDRHVEDYGKEDGK